MQVSRYWRTKKTRYQLAGVRYENGQISVQSRPQCKDVAPTQTSVEVVKAVPHKIPA